MRNRYTERDGVYHILSPLLQLGYNTKSSVIWVQLPSSTKFLLFQVERYSVSSETIYFTEQSIAVPVCVKKAYIIIHGVLFRLPNIFIKAYKYQGV